MNGPFSISFPAKSEHLAVLRDWCRNLLSPVLPPGPLDQMILALCEAVANNIKHCFDGDARRQVQVELEVLKSKVVARVRNFCYAEHAHKIKSRKLEDVKPGGLGMRFINESVDRVEYVTEGDGFMTLVLTKNRKGGARGD